MTNLERVDEFINATRVFFLSTTDGDKPKTRPLNFHFVINGKLCFLTGNKKNVYKQLMVNPKVQITAINPRSEWLRIEGTTSLCEDQDFAEKFLANSPFLRDKYAEMDMKLCLFQIDEASVEIRSWGLLEQFDLYE